MFAGHTWYLPAPPAQLAHGKQALSNAVHQRELDSGEPAGQRGAGTGMNGASAPSFSEKIMSPLRRSDLYSSESSEYGILTGKCPLWLSNRIHTGEKSEQGSLVKSEM